MEKLILLLLVCHWMGDFSPLSTPWMLHAKSTGKPLLPILVHASIHGLLMCTALLFFTSFPFALGLGAFQAASHFLIDVGKGKLNVGFPTLANPNHKNYWMVFGLDQLLHQFIIVLMACLAHQA